MKKFQLIFILAILGYCFSDDSDNCSLNFPTTIKDKCTLRHGSCDFKPSNYSEMCISINTNNCQLGKDDSAICNNIFHPKFPEYKCEYNSLTGQCNEEITSCNDFNTDPSTHDSFYGIYFNQKDRDLCDKFKTGTANNKICRLSNSLACTEYFPSCQNLGISDCQNNIISYTQECYWDDTNSRCAQRERTCNSLSPLKNVIKEECIKLKTSTPTLTKCVYTEEGCIEKNLCEATRTIEPTQDSDCTGIIPLKLTENGGEYDYKYKCTYVRRDGTTPGYCKKEESTCSDYPNVDPSICLGLKSKEPNKICVYDGICKEEYGTCELYSDNKVNKDRNGCEHLSLILDNIKCVYNVEEDKCMSEKTYESCEAYDGISQKICESIKPSAHSRCVLDKDSKCKERAFFCSEVFDSESCLYYAKASNSNKRCEFRAGVNSQIGECYEEYLRCEDYIPGDSTTDCEDIVLHNGKKCFMDPSNRCRTQNKTCSDAGSREECELIAHSGVSNPDKLVCHWSEYDENGNSDSYKCRETYKYCSDYRGISTLFCQNNIQPYIESEDKIDITSKCYHESGIGCQKVTKECEDLDVDNNPVLCSLISPKIQDNNKKYCAFIAGHCKKQYKTCEDWDNSDTTISCTAIIPENYLDSPCELKVVNGKRTCYTQKFCNVFPFEPSDTTTASSYYEDLCHSLGHECEYSTEGCTTKKELSCTDIKFYEHNNNNEETCKGMEVSVPYKICRLKEDKSGCEEIIDISFITPPSDSTENNNPFILNESKLLLILLCLLI